MNRKRVITIVVGAAVLVAAGGGIAYASLNNTVQVKVATASAKILAVTVDAPGTVTAVGRRGVYPPTAATIAKLEVADGDRVSAGQVLVRLHTGPLKLAVAQAEAALATARAQAGAASNAAPTGSELSAASRAISAANSALSTAKKNYADYLADYNAASPTDQDAMRPTLRTLRSARDQASATLAVARANRDRLSRSGQNGLATHAGSLSIAAAKLALAQAKANLEAAELTAPVDGTVVVPSTVEAGAGVTPGVPVVSVSEPSGLVFEASVDQSDISSITAGQAATVSLDAFAGQGLTGKVLSRSQSASTTATGGVAFITKISLPAGSVQPLAGMGGSVAITVKDLADALTVPAAAVVSNGEQRYVFVVADGVVHRTAVRIGAETDTAIQIVEGLSAGDQVVSTGASSLADGQSVKVVQ
ncbi:RND family efflux transporter MFP subunit [Propionicimonas paludicola]|uniref:RND family efflux transporter MFP subunit n=1 Tax=Propionicimonas paludicola TaxID=185243 RepID=A0A2A9CTH4_9ACTN|nr:efflux RND transporter periplasmic adaptor subunit [Propionicimonas paludicola]PFG17416.1 RND family efflux transporter MFP subunit [Propionicimonas paludicola]